MAKSEDLDGDSDRGVVVLSYVIGLLTKIVKSP